MQAVARMFSNHAYESELGSRVATEAGFKLLISNTAFASDFGFIAQERLPKDCNCTGSGEVMPDFSVEVERPSHSLTKSLTKSYLWRMAGMKPVRLINYETHMMTAPSQTAFMHAKVMKWLLLKCFLENFAKKNSDFFT